jgi:hypothetical protein
MELKTGVLFLKNFQLVQLSKRLENSVERGIFHFIEMAQPLKSWNQYKELVIRRRLDFILSSSKAR